MPQIIDCFGRTVRLTEERLAHILEHPEMMGMDSQIEIVVSNPQIVRRSRTAESAALYYRFYTETKIGDKWLCVVVKYDDDDAFVVTAYFTDKLKAGEDLWPTK